MSKGEFITDGIVPLRGVVRAGVLAAILDHEGNELGAPVAAKVNEVTGGSRLTAGDKTVSVSGEGYKRAVLLGDSITSQHKAEASGIPVVGSQGFWNWANWLVGAPFDFSMNIGVSGSTAADIFSRINQIPSDEDTVFVLAGTNDVNGVADAANAATIAAAIDSLIGTTGCFTLGLSRLKAAGKQVAIATIPPNTANIVGSSKIAVLDAVNAWIMNSVTAGYADEVLDLFTACWDSAAPTTRVFKTNYSTDGTHLTNLAGFAGGKAFIEPMKRMYARAASPAYITQDRENQTQHIGAMRVISGVSSTISTGGTGTPATDMAGGWRSLRGAGTPTWACSIVDYTASSNFVGPAASMVGVGEKMQQYVCASGADGDNVKTQLATAIAARGGNPGIGAGDAFYVSMEVVVESPVNLRSASIQGVAYHTAGTAPAEQPYGASAAQSRADCCISSVAATDYPLPEGYRAVFRTRNVRVAENITNPDAISAQFFVNTTFAGVGSATIKLARPQFMRKT